MENDRITMAHGAGGQQSQELIERIILPAFGNPLLNELHDGAAVTMGNGKIAFTTDSYVVKPLFFAGGNIGKLAVCGTVNDL
ncbi:MAG: AIR synthase related protein, partial [Selenomonadaceae bacterium]